MEVLLKQKTYSEFVVAEGSPLIGLKQKDIVKNYGVEIKHYHNPHTSYETRKPYDPEKKIEKNFTIKVYGTVDNIRKLRLVSVDF